MTLDAVSSQFARVAGLPGDSIDLARAAFLIAATDNPSLDVDRELDVLGSLAAGASNRLSEKDDPLRRLNVLSEYLFDEVGFRGNQEDYYDPRNSFLNEVLSRRAGIPITLSVVYIEIGRRLGVPLVGIGMPGHFLVRHRNEESLFIDPFNGGILLSEEECAQRLSELTQATVPWDSRYLAPVSDRDIIARMLRNLKAIYLARQDDGRALAMIDWLLTLDAQAPHELRDRGVLRYRLGHYAEALEDLSGYLASVPSGPDSRAMGELVARLRRLLDG